MIDRRLAVSVSIGCALFVTALLCSVPSYQAADTLPREIADDVFWKTTPKAIFAKFAVEVGREPSARSPAPAAPRFSKPLTDQPCTACRATLITPLPWMRNGI